MASQPAQETGPAYLTALAADIYSRWLAYSEHARSESLHPCFISSEPHLVTRKGLASDHPADYRALVSIANALGVQVIEDRRQKQQQVAEERRKQLALAVGLFMGMTVKQLAFAQNGSPPVTSDATTISKSIDDHASVAALKSAAHRNPSTSLMVSKSADGKLTIGARQLRHSHHEQQHMDEILRCFQNGIDADASCPQASADDVQTVREILSSHLGVNDAGSNTRLVIEEIAGYYARYPAIVELLSELDQMDWQLRTRAMTWQASAYISQFKVQRVEVFFDPTTAAQMLFMPGCVDNPQCTVSPADALLHELLHAYLMLKHPRDYAAQNSHALYPLEHEHDVIEMENRLYASMSQDDGLPRPNRSRHEARLIAVGCPVCIAAND